MVTLRPRNAALLEAVEPYVVATPFARPHLDLAPFGWALAPEHVLDPLRLRTEPFLALLQRLDVLAFGPEGMPMPRWVFYDCAELPGAIFGLGQRVERLDPDAARLFDVPPGYDGIVPLSMYVAIPMAPAGAWFGHNLSSLGPRLDRRRYRGLGTLTKVLALRVFGVRHFYGATQWDSAALFIHVRFGPLDLMTAYTPAHSEPETLTYHFPVDARVLRAAAGESGVTLPRPEPTETVRSDDSDHMRALQAAIEAGQRVVVPGPPRVDASGVFHVPVARL